MKRNNKSKKRNESNSGNNQPPESEAKQLGGTGLPRIRPMVAGIDVGSKEHWVCAPTGKGGTEMRVFGANTPELVAMADWFQRLGVESVAMESTGVYWIPLFELLESRGIEVILTDTRHLTRVPGRKTDFEDCQWIQLLHSCGLLQGCFRPGEAICQLRSLVRNKAVLVAERSDWLRRMQKCLDQMNVRVHRAVSDIDGTTGMAILRAIVAGERDAVKLAKHRDPRCRKSEASIARELTGNWRWDHLFNLEQGLKMYELIEERIGDYQREIQKQMQALRCKQADGNPLQAVKNKEKAKAIKRRGQEPMREVLHGLAGADLTTIDTIGVETAEVVLSEYGADLSRFPTEKQFVKHLRLAPRQSITGGKPMRKGKGGKGATRTGNALRMAATVAHHSRTAIGAYYRRLAARKGSDVAVFATARKLASLIYRMLRWGQPYVDEGVAEYEKRYQAARIRHLQAQANQLGFQLAPQTTTA
jgi:transposase